MKYLKKFKQQQQYDLFKDSEDFILPNVTYIVNDDIVLYNSVPSQEPEQTFMLRAKYNATPDNLLAFNGVQNIKSLKVNENSIKIEPVKNNITTFDVLGENISLDMETGEATLPESYLIKSPVTSWSFKVKDPNYVINENTYACMLGMVDGMAFAEPIPLAESIGSELTTNDGVTLEVTDAFLTYLNMEIQSGMPIGYTLCDMDMDSETLVFIDTEHQTNAPTGGLFTYSFDSEGYYDVEIELPDPVIRTVFNGTPLISIEIGDGITSIGDSAFYECKGLTSINIPYGIKTIGTSAFYYCENLTSINIPYSVTSIGIEAFSFCHGLTGELVIPDSVTSIGDSAFYYCDGLTSIVIPDSVTEINNYVFANCDGLTSIVIPNGVTSIGESAFYRCSGLTSIVIPDGVTEIANDTFDSCSGLTSINIPNSVTSIGKSAFQSCSNLTEINIPDGVTTIGDQAFYRCSGLTGELVIPDGVTTIGESAFYGCSGLTSIVIPDSVTSIANDTFNFCSGLTSINIPNSVTSIGESAFWNCSGLTSINIPDSVTSIGRSAFWNCSGLTGELVIPDGVTTIGEAAFSNCKGLTSITIGSGVTEIRSSAFYGCSSLTTITCYAQTAPSIKSDIFYSIKSNGTLYVPAGSDYSSWMSTGNYYLGKYNWKIQYI